MRKIVLILTVLLTQSISCMAQENQEVVKFLGGFYDFVTAINKVETPTEVQIETWKLQYNEIKKNYSTKYKDIMTNDELEIYYNYVGQYNKKMRRETMKEAGEWIDSTSVKVGESMKRGAKKVSGVLKGFFKKDKKE